MLKYTLLFFCYLTLTHLFLSFTLKKANLRVSNSLDQAPIEDCHKPEEEKKVVDAEPLKTETKIITNPAILDLEKARRTEALLGNGKLEEKVEVKVEPVKAEEKLVNIQYGNDATTKELPKADIPKPVDVVKEKPKAPKRTYNEPHVSESVKELKGKFDEIVYTPLPEKKPVVETPKPTTPEKVTPAKTATTQATKTVAKKDSIAKKITPKVESKTIDGKTAKVEKTTTGIVREVKKNDPKTDAKATDKKNTTDAKKKTTDDKKKVTEDKKKVAGKEKTVASNKAKDSKKTDSKSTGSKAADGKKTDKKASSKTDPKKKK